MGYNSVADNTGLSFVQLLLVPESVKFRRIRADSSVQSSKVIDLGVNRKLICDFLLVINSNFGLPTSRYLRLKLGNGSFYQPLPCLMPRSGNTSEFLDETYPAKARWLPYGGNVIILTSTVFG